MWLLQYRSWAKEQGGIDAYPTLDKAIEFYLKNTDPVEISCSLEQP